MRAITEHFWTIARTTQLCQANFLSVCVSVSVSFCSRTGCQIWAPGSLHHPFSASASFSFCVCVCYLYLFSMPLQVMLCCQLIVSLCVCTNHTRRSRNYKEAQPIRIQLCLIMSLVCLLLLTLISLPQSLSLFLPN